MSLQLENFKLEKQNFNLEKQLLEQELMMERREKQLLKNRLKRIKTQHQEQSERTTPNQPKAFNTPKTHNQSNKLENNSTKQTKVSDFQISPIRIKIPELELQGQENLYCSIPAKRKNQKIEEDIDSLLLSEDSEKRRS